MHSRGFKLFLVKCCTSVAFSGDIFEDERDDSWLVNSRYPDLQKSSRSSILAVADWIIPGHGKLFKSCRDVGH